MQPGLTTPLSGIGSSSVLGGAVDVNPLTFRAPTKPAAASDQAAVRAGREFEALFLSEMLQPMFEGLKTDGVFGGGNGEKMFRSLQVDEYAKALTRSGGVGIAPAITREILRMQEAARAPAAR